VNTDNQSFAPLTQFNNWGFKISGQGPVVPTGNLADHDDTQQQSRRTDRTATIAGNKMMLRDMEKKFMATIVWDKDGNMTMYDENGNVLDHKDALEIKPFVPPSRSGERQ
jgi:hypothetical protein